MHQMWHSILVVMGIICSIPTILSKPNRTYEYVVAVQNATGWVVLEEIGLNNKALVVFQFAQTEFSNTIITNRKYQLGDVIPYQFGVVAGSNGEIQRIIASGTKQQH